MCLKFIFKIDIHASVVKIKKIYVTIIDISYVFIHGSVKNKYTYTKFENKKV